jgi:hypothetical protein
MPTPKLASDGFSITKRVNTFWPTEIYDIIPKYINNDVATIPIKGNTYKAQNIFRYINNPTSDNNKILNEYNVINFNYSNLKYIIYEGLSNLNPSLSSYFYGLSAYSKLASTFSFAPSNLRLIDTGEFFNFFSIEYQTSTNDISSFSYSLIPERMFNYPVSSYFDGTNYKLRTNTVIIPSKIDINYGKFSQNKAYNNILNYNSTKPLTAELIIPPYNLLSTVSAYKTVRDRKINDLNLNYIQSNVFLEDSPQIFEVGRSYNFSDFTSIDFVVGTDIGDTTTSILMEVGFTDNPSTSVYSIISDGYGNDLRISWSRNDDTIYTYRGTSIFSIDIYPWDTLKDGYFIFTTTPTTKIQKILPKIFKIRPDSTYLTYDTTYINSNSTNNIGQNLPELDYYLIPDLKSSLILRQDLKNQKNQQTFQLAQSSIFKNLKLDDIKNTLQLVTLDLTSTKLTYEIYSEDIDDDGKYILPIIPNSLGITYKIDSNQFLNDSTTRLGFTSTRVNPNIFDYTLKYPPHYYTFNVSYSSNKFLTYGATTNLNFNLATNINTYYYSDVNLKSVSAVLLSSYLFSNFNILNLDFSTYCKDDEIIFYSYFIKNKINEVVENAYLSALECFYGPNLNVYYDLNNPTYIPAISASKFLIKYPSEKYGEFDLFLFSSLKCSTLTEIDNDKVLRINFSYGKPVSAYEYPIYIEKIRELQNRMDLSCAVLSSDNFYSTKDLTNSFISWSYRPTSLDVKIIPINRNDFTPFKDSNFSNITINPQETLLFSENTSNICISGYGIDNIIVTLSSQKYNETAEIKNVIYDYFYLNDSDINIIPSNLIRYDQVVNFSLSGNRDYNGTILPIPSSADIYWNWDYYNKNLVKVYYKGSIEYTENNILDAYLLSSINVVINPDYKDLISQTQPIKFNLNLLAGNGKTLTGSYSTNIFLLPNDNIINVDFEVKALNISSPNNKTYKTRNKTNLITRPDTDLNKFSFKGNSDIIPFLKYQSLTWNISTDTNYSLTTSYSLVSELSVIFSDILKTHKISKAIITLSAHKAILPNWLISRNLSSQFTLNFLPSSVFNSPLQFNIYSPYTWLNDSNGYITLLNDSNFNTLSIAPTAYANKKSLSQNFYVSANKKFDNFDYHFSSNKKYLTTLSSFSGIIDIPYHNEFYSDVGTTIYLSAYKNDLFPRYDGLTYVGLTTSYNEYIGYFPIATNTLPFSSTYINTNSAFFQSPKLLEYNALSFNYSVNDTAIDLDNNVFVTVTQTISDFNLDSPIKIANTDFTQSITYIISSKYWVTDINIPAIDGTFDLFILRIGDPSEVLTIKDLEITSLTITPSSNIPLKIPKTTFQFVSSDMNGEIDLWNEKAVPINAKSISLFAYSTSVKPDLFISSYYSTTGNDIFFQFKTPENSFNLKISSYDLFFGDGESIRILDNSTIYKSYILDDTYNIYYIANYTNGKSIYFELDNPIIVFKEWPHYDQNKIRLLSENQLYFGNAYEKTYNLNEIEIQPNEWGDVDIFNTAINRLHSNFNYLRDNIQTLDTNSPTFFYGWLGTNIDKKTDGISWHTENYKKFYVDYPNKATSSGSNYFLNLKDAVETKDRFYVIDDTTIRAFSASKIPQEIVFENKKAIDDMLINPISIDIDDSGENIYVVDNFKNKIYKLNLDFDFYPPQINVQLNIGNFGKKDEPNKLNSPTELIYKKEIIFVLDYNNRCVKQYTKDLNWMFTYYDDRFESDQPINIAIHPETLLVYILTENYKIYIFDYFNSFVFEVLDISNIDKTYKPLKMFFDEYGDFFYIVTQKYIYKYSTNGSYITETTLPNTENLDFITGKSSYYRSNLILTKNSILKFNDIVSLFKIGEGLDYNYWSENQIKLNSDDLALDLNYNTSLVRLCQNIKQFRNNLNSKFVLVYEKKNFGVIKYYSIYPISYNNNLIFSDDIENETIGVGVNEFHIPQVLNREFKKLYTALEQLRDFLEIKDVRMLDGSNSNLTDACNQAFCWSWKAMSCYGLSLPVIKICNINPITYAELESDFPSEYSYAPSKNFGNATSECCRDLKSPLQL